MLTTLIGIQTIAVVTATSYVIKHFKPKSKMKVYSNYKCFKQNRSF